MVESFLSGRSLTGPMPIPAALGGRRGPADEPHHRIVAVRANHPVPNRRSGAPAAGAIGDGVPMPARACCIAETQSGVSGTPFFAWFRAARSAEPGNGGPSWTMRTLSRARHRTKFITPALRRPVGMRCCQLRGGCQLHKGRIHRARQAGQSRARPNAPTTFSIQAEIPLALIEARKFHSVGDGMQQGLEYAARSTSLSCFSSMATVRFPRPHRREQRGPRRTLASRRVPVAVRLWAPLPALEGPDARSRQIVLQDYFRRRKRQGPSLLPGQCHQRDDRTHRERPRPHLARHGNRDRKTIRPSRSFWRLWKWAARSASCFWADRNVLIDKTMVNDFRPFVGSWQRSAPGRTQSRNWMGTVADLTNRHRFNTADNKSYEVYLGLYQALNGPENGKSCSRVFTRLF